MSGRRAAIAVVVLALAGAGAAAAGLTWLRRPGPPVDRPITITVDEGERFADIATDLKRQGLLTHALPLVAWARLTGQDRGVRWGEFLVTTPLTPLELLARVTGPPDPLHQVLIAEGRTMREAVAALAAAGFGSEESFLCVLDDPEFLASEDLPPTGAEGYLFPDTYAFPLATPQADATDPAQWCVAQFPWMTGSDDGTPGAPSDCGP